MPSRHLISHLSPNQSHAATSPTHLSLPSPTSPSPNAHHRTHPPRSTSWDPGPPPWARSTHARTLPCSRSHLPRTAPSPCALGLAAAPASSPRDLLAGRCLPSLPASSSSTPRRPPLSPIRPSKLAVG